MEDGEWICDTCGDAIIDVEDGLIEWVRVRHGAKSTTRDIRLVHRNTASPRLNGCQFKRSVEYRKDGGQIGDRPLREFLGLGGWLKLREVLDDVPVPIVASLIERIGARRVSAYSQS